MKLEKAWEMAAEAFVSIRVEAQRSFANRYRQA